MVLEYKVHGVGKYMKSSAIGWDSEWGKLKLFTAKGSKTSGSMRPFGLDCSGYLTWVWRNAGMRASDIGNGAMEQYGNCRPITWADAIPGHVAFYDDLSHVRHCCRVYRGRQPFDCALRVWPK